MYTFTHPFSPTVTYAGDLPTSVASYACDHLYDFDVTVVETLSQPGIGLELFDKQSGECLGIVTVQ